MREADPTEAKAENANSEEFAVTKYGEVLQWYRASRNKYPPPHRDLTRKEATTFRQLQVTSKSNLDSGMGETRLSGNISHGHVPTMTVYKVCNRWRPIRSTDDSHDNIHPEIVVLAQHRFYSSSAGLFSTGPIHDQSCAFDAI
ncbi:hypothetical protein HPB50_019895 [Hyalomma asiaticum]|uniref:Uncharacterized protein n=1 Tax=Hyalomma asiaticum TaxID=266040 RepID=A0ACB7S570_HYAAI|nr:hypothetical protein HPB50_019895 [Hyalomma asiaticum]